MSDKVFDIPAIAQSVDPAIRIPYTRMREAIQTLTGTIGDGSNAAYTARRIGSGLGSSSYGGESGAGTSTTIDLTPPPTVTNFRATAGFSQVIVQWDAAVYSQGHGPKQTNVYAVKRSNPDTGPAPTFGDAQLVDSAIDPLTIDSLASELNTVWHLWAKFETVDGVESLAPAGGINGVVVTTGQDIAQLLAILTGQIRQSQLYADLGTRINLIDGASSVPGSVNYRLAATAADLTSSFQSGNATTYANAQTYVQSYAYSRSTIDGAFTSQYNALTASYQAGDGATLTSAQSYVQTYAYSKADANSATAAAITTLSASLASFEAFQKWDFDSTTEGWAGIGATLSASGQYLRVTSAGIDPVLESPPVSIIGAYDKIRVRLRRVAGSGWDGTIFYVNAAHPEGGGYQKSIAQPGFNGSDWLIAEWDMATLPDWSAGTTSSFRIDFGNAAADVFDIDWIAVGKRGAGPTVVALQQESTARADADGALFAQWTVKLDVNGYVSGFGLASTSGSAVPTSSFIVRADSFAIASPSGPGIMPATPFIVRTTASTENGVSIPVGVFIDAAYIVNVSAVYGRFGSLIADSLAAGQINAAHLTLGDGTIGGNLKSANYSGGSAGWIVRPDGYAEFSNVVIRGSVYTGTIYAAAGTIGGITIGAADVRSPNYVPGTTGHRINADGSAEFYNITARGNITATSMNAATGTFGSVTIAAGGSISSGQTAFNTGVGFWLGQGGGTPVFSIGNSAGKNLRWDGTDLLISNATFDSMTAAIVGGNLSVSANAGFAVYGTRSITVSGGRSPFNYSWLVTHTGGGYTGDIFASGGSTVTVAGTGNGVVNEGNVTCLVTDANGRVTSAAFHLYASHYYDAGSGGGGGDGGAGGL